MSQCAICLEEAPTVYVVLSQNIGALFARFHRRVEGELCKNCITRIFGRFTGITLLLGWWGFISAVITPIILVRNTGYFCIARYKLWGDEESPRANAPGDRATYRKAWADDSDVNFRGGFGPTLEELTQDQPPVSRSTGYFGWFKIAVVVAIFVLAIISLMWKQIEPVAPGINKMLHSDVTAQDDVDYQSAKLDEARAQYDKATTCTKDEPAADCRERMLTQGQAALTKMEYHSSKLQEAFPHEHITEECVPLINNLMATTTAYYNGEQAVINAVKDNRSAELDAAGALESTAVANLERAKTALKANHGCAKF